MPNMEIHYANDWAALYVDGVLEPNTVGDSYHAEERAFEILGVRQVYDAAFMRGQDYRAGVARTLHEVREFKDQQTVDLTEAQALRDQAHELSLRAMALEEKAGSRDA